MPLKITSLEAVPTIGIDIGRTTFHLIGNGRLVLRQKWSRRQVEARLQLRNTNLKPGTDTPAVSQRRLAHHDKNNPIGGAVLDRGAMPPTHNARAICGSTSPASAHNEESDTPMRRTPFRSGN